MKTSIRMLCLLLPSFSISAHAATSPPSFSLLTLQSSGCACDIPSVSYQYIWHPKVWSKYYATQPEILSYFKSVVDEFGLAKYCKLRHQVEHAEWDDEEGCWNVEIKDLESGNKIRDKCDIFVNCMGFLKYDGSKTLERTPLTKAAATGDGPTSMACILSKAPCVTRHHGRRICQ